MRIISGKHKGRRITAPGNLPVRPTTDMAKEALFNILNNDYYFDQVRVLDLFSGIGSISLEFASRGSDHIVSVDSHYGCVNFLEKINSELQGDIQTVKSDAFLFLERSNEKFDIIFADPPYDMDIDNFQKLVNLIFEKGLLDTDGKVIIEHGQQTSLSEHPNFDQLRKYGSNIFSFFSLKE